MSSVLVMAAHPDDELLGVGGTILRHLDANDEVTIHLADPCRQPDWSKPQALASRIGAKFLTTFDTEPTPDIIYTHHVGDLNADHRRVAERALVIGRFAKTVRTFETVSSTEWGLTPFQPDYYVEVDFWRKAALLDEFYGDEMRQEPHPRSRQNLAALAQWRGSTAGFHYAEAFCTIRDRW
jgi:LmbE family N-acetylglucosaminyl deacetylase